MSDEKHRARNARYLNNTVDSIMIRVPKGKKQEIKAAADAAGVSVNRYCADAIETRLNAEKRP